MRASEIEANISQNQKHYRLMLCSCADCCCSGQIGGAQIGSAQLTLMPGKWPVDSKQIEGIEMREQERTKAQTSTLASNRRSRGRGVDWKRRRRTEVLKRISIRLLRWPLVHLCLPLLLLATLVGGSNCASLQLEASEDQIGSSYNHPAGEVEQTNASAQLKSDQILPWAWPRSKGEEAKEQQQQQQHVERANGSTQISRRLRQRRAASAQETRKSEPPSRPTADWSSKRPHFGREMQRDVSVDLGKTAYLSCRVHELGDKTVSWLRPRQNEILTSGGYTYIGDSRFTPINPANSSADWILEIKDVTLSDSTSYECQVSTDPKMSAIINLHVKAARARIKQGEQYTAPASTSIEFTCDIQPAHLATAAAAASASSGQLQPPAQSLWYHNGNLINYAKTGGTNADKNFSIEWDPHSQVSRLRLFGVQQRDSGNYTCKPISAEPATIRLHVKKSSHRTITGHNRASSSGQRLKQDQNYGPIFSQSYDQSESNGSSARFLASRTDAWTILIGLSILLIAMNSQPLTVARQHEQSP